MGQATAGKIRLLCHVPAPTLEPNDLQRAGLDTLCALREVQPVRVLPLYGAVLGGQLPGWSEFEEDFQRPLGAPYLNVVCGTFADMVAGYTADVKNVGVSIGGAPLPNQIDTLAQYELVIVTHRADVEALAEAGVPAMHLPLQSKHFANAIRALVGL